jgi:hypothetical protein
MMAAAPRVRAADAPAVTYPASAPVTCAMYLLAAACSSVIDTESADASAMASTTSGGIRAPPTRVEVPDTLMIVRTPNSSYTPISLGSFSVSGKTWLYRH